MAFARISFLAGLLFLTALTASASEEEKNEMKWRPAQVTFITPLGSNWIHSWKTGNNFSLNILFGMNGGLKGAEFSGLAGMIRDDATGAQFAGLANTVGGTFRGMQAAGLVNVAAKRMNGFQTAGLVSVAGGYFQGAQINGLAAVTSGDLKGAQINGLAGIAGGTMKGVQISGLFNYARKLDGVQLGLFNYADTVKRGVPIGLFSVVGHGGYYAFEITAGETFYGTASFKMGMKRFYNIFSLGAGYRNEQIIWGWGAGFGTLFNLSQKLDLSLEALCYQVNLGEWFTHGPNLLNKINISLGWNISPHVALVFTPSWNVTVMDLTDEYGEKTREPFAPYSVYSKTWDNDMNVRMYPGLSVGVRL